MVFKKKDSFFRKIENFKDFLRPYFGNNESEKSLMVDKIIMILIFLTSFFYIIETYPLPQIVLDSMIVIDILIMFIFTVEVIVRFWVSEFKKRYFNSIYTWIDILAIFPFWFGIGNLNFLRIFRFFKILRYSERYLKFNSHIPFFGDFDVHKVFLIKMLFTLFVILYVSSGMIYTFERPYNDNIVTFDDSLYFTLVTVTTVGFGDITPVTKLGKIVTMFVIISGVILIPWHIGNLMKYLVHDSKKTDIYCDNCGFRFHDNDARYCKICGSKLNIKKL